MTKKTASAAGIFSGFWAWYDRHYTLNLTVTTFLFALQLVHLYWLTTHVVAFGLIGQSLFSPPPFWQYVIIIVDYTEIPGLVSTSIFYIHQLRKRGASFKPIFFLFLLNSQWLHLFWITDSFVLNSFRGIGTGGIPPSLAWIAIAIDYLELPVIFDTFKNMFRELRKGHLKGALEQIKED